MIPTFKRFLTMLSNKVDKVSGKGLSTNDFTDDLKEKLEGISGEATAVSVEEIIVSPIEPQTDRRKVWFQKGKNIIPTNFEEWVRGQYNVDTGLATDSTIRIRLKKLLKIKAGQTYYFNTFSNFGFIVRTYDINGTFLKSVGSVENGSIFTANNNEEYISITIYDPNATTTYPLYDDYRTLFLNRTIKPLICLNSEEDKTFEEYIDNAIYVKNDNGEYEEFTKKETSRIDKIEEMMPNKANTKRILNCNANNLTNEGSGLFIASSQIANFPNNASNMHYYVIQAVYNTVQNEGYALQIAVPLHSTASISYRRLIMNNWESWKAL